LWRCIEGFKISAERECELYCNKSAVLLYGVPGQIGLEQTPKQFKRMICFGDYMWRNHVSGALKAGNMDESTLNLNDASSRKLANIASVRRHVLSRAQELKNAARNRKYGTDMFLLNAQNQSALNLADNGNSIGAGLMNTAGWLSDDMRKKTVNPTTTANLNNQPPNPYELTDARGHLAQKVLEYNKKYPNKQFGLPLFLEN